MCERVNRAEDGFLRAEEQRRQQQRTTEWRLWALWVEGIADRKTAKRRVLKQRGTRQRREGGQQQISRAAAKAVTLA